MKNEAVKRGFKTGNYKCLVGASTYVHSDNYQYYFNENKLFTGWNKNDRRNLVFNNGTWAEIIDQPKEITISERLERIEKHLGL